MSSTPVATTSTTARTVAVQPVQGTLEDLGTPLHEVTFVVVDLETTGGSAENDRITEIGAVKVRGGVELGEFQTFVDAGVPVPPLITALTGITDRMLVDAPPVQAALASFWEFARGAVLVAHNARFDMSFLRRAGERDGHPWPSPTVLDTVRLARAVLARGETPNAKLATLAAHFAARTPDHRALHDARATVDVLHALIGRVGSLGVHGLEELAAMTARSDERRRRRRHLADGLPSGPGVYLFHGPGDEVLYVGTSTDVRRRVRSYFTAAERRTRMTEMVGIAERVSVVRCATTLEARVRELRLIESHSPRYNRRSRAPRRQPWLKLTDEPFPRLSVVREVRPDGAAYVGPFTSARDAEDAADAVHEVFALRRCRRRLRATPRPGDEGACALAELGRCGAPCEGRQSVEEYAVVTDLVRSAMGADSAPMVTGLLERITALAGGQRYEDAARHRDRLVRFVRAAARTQRIGPLAACPELVAARRAGSGGWELVLVRHGRLAGTSHSPRGADPMPFVSALTAAGEHVDPPAAPAAAGSHEEAEAVLAWLEAPGTRLVHLDGDWACPVGGAGRFRDLGAYPGDASRPRVPPRVTAEPGDR